MILGIDIGGTKIKYALFDKSLNTIESGEVQSYAICGAKVLLENLFDLIDKFKFDGLGVSTAGIVGKSGEIVYANDNIPNYTGVKLKEILQTRYGVPVVVLNDIDACAICEYYYSKCDDFYFIALGTGVGGAFVKDGKIVKGNSSFAGQIGYLNTSCGDTVDNAVSTRGLEKISGVDGKRLFEMVKFGDTVARQNLLKWVKELANLIKMVVGFFSPSKIVLGGAICSQGDFLVDIIKSECDKFPLPYNDSFVLTTATKENLSGALGSVIALINNGEKVYE